MLPTLTTVLLALTSTIGKWKIPLNASIGVMTGVNTTPWHLTIGNPYSPILTVSNVVVENVDIKMNNSIGFYDMSTGFKLNIGIKFVRNDLIIFAGIKSDVNTYKCNPPLLESIGMIGKSYSFILSK